MFSAESIQHLAQQLRGAAASPARVVLFGSHARGTAHAGSDLDLLVIEESLPCKSEEYARLLRVIGAREVDLILMSEGDFTKRKDWVGSLPYRAHREGRVLCG
jgi:uncharacterized protein